MGDDQFLPGLETFKQPFTTPLSADPSIAFFTSPFPGTNPGHHHPPAGLHNVNHTLTGSPLPISFPESNTETFPPGLLFIRDSNSPVAPVNDPTIKHQAGEKRKSTDISSPGNSPANSDNGSTKKKCLGRGRKATDNETEENKLREVVHVRAKRGQATDNHSLAERVRREKINERLRCLQDIVPGCYKTMGMAVMLDEIINYVQSLQNQVEFLSMKLTAASTFHDFNSETDALEAIQRVKAFQAIKVQNGASPELTSMCLNFGSYPQLPHER